MSVQTERAISSEDACIVVGDFNAKISGEIQVVSYEKDSPNGKQLSDMIQDKLHVGNFHPKAQGKWTRIQAMKKGDDKKSVLDYVLLSPGLSQSLEKLLIDEEKIYCPSRVKKQRGKSELVFSDHCSIIFELKVETGAVRKCNQKQCN